MKRLDIELMGEAVRLLKATRSAWLWHYRAPEILSTIYEMDHGDRPCEHPSYFVPYRNTRREFCSVCGEFKT